MRSWKGCLTAGAIAISIAPVAVQGNEGGPAGRSAAEEQGGRTCDCRATTDEGGVREGASVQAPADRNAVATQGRKPATRAARPPRRRARERDPGDDAAELAAGNSQGRG
jgi:hypothetical protein